MKKIILFLMTAFFLSANSFSQENLQLMFYNLYRFPDSPPQYREYLLKDILDSIQPDLLMACEIISEEGANKILNTSLSGQSDSFAFPDFHYCQSALEDPLQQMVFYNTRKLIFIRQKVLETTVRDINHYTFILNHHHLPEDSVFLEVFVTHLKSSNTVANRLMRAAMVDTFLKALNSIPLDHTVLFAGDFNFYKASTELAFQKIIDSINPILMVDPINKAGDWHDNPDFSDIHTQATRISTAGFGIGGASGGMDDRFDFIMMSENCRSNPSLNYVENSYKAYGNNGNCFDKSIHDPTCSGPYSFTLRQKLHEMSDHIPVIMNLTTNKQFPTYIPRILKEKAYFSYQNPIQNTLTLKLINTISKSDKIMIYNIFGQLKHTIPVYPNIRQLSIDLSSIAPGHYFFRLAETPSRTMRFIKY